MDSPLHEAEKLEAVYYPSPVPLDIVSLTPLGLIFDRIHFPDVYLPTDGYDFRATHAERERIKQFGFRDYNSVTLLQAMDLLPVVGHLKTFCEFTGDGRLFGAKKDPRLEKVVQELELLMFGPAPEGVLRINETCAHKGLPGGEKHFEYPGALFYPARAMIYAHDHGLPLINDQPGIPVPSLGGERSAKNDEKVLSIILASECMRLALPKLKPLHPLELVELREELKPYLGPFRLGLLRLAKQLNAAIDRTSSDGEVREAAEFLVKTEVIPQLAELRSQVERPDKPWYSKAFAAAKYAPTLSAAYASVPVAMIAAGLTAVCEVLINTAEAQRRKQNVARSGMYFLLKLLELEK